MEAICNMLEHYRQYMDDFTAKKYPDAFARFSQAAAPILQPWRALTFKKPRPPCWTRGAKYGKPRNAVGTAARCGTAKN